MLLFVGLSAMNMVVKKTLEILQAYFNSLLINHDLQLVTTVWSLFFERARFQRLSNKVLHSCSTMMLKLSLFFKQNDGIFLISNAEEAVARRLVNEESWVRGRKM